MSLVMLCISSNTVVYIENPVPYCWRNSHQRINASGQKLWPVNVQNRSAKSHPFVRVHLSNADRLNWLSALVIAHVINTTNQSVRNVMFIVVLFIFTSFVGNLHLETASESNEPNQLSKIHWVLLDQKYYQRHNTHCQKWQALQTSLSRRWFAWTEIQRRQTNASSHLVIREWRPILRWICGRKLGSKELCLGCLPWNNTMPSAFGEGCHLPWYCLSHPEANWQTTPCLVHHIIPKPKSAISPFFTFEFLRKRKFL